jgi:hypothetical protein
VLINEAMAREFWKDGDALAERILIAKDIGKEFEGDPVRQIVGIVGDVRHRSLDSDSEPRIYVPQVQLSDATSSWLLRLAPTVWVVRTQVPSQTTTQTIRQEIRQATGLPVFGGESMEEIVAISTNLRRFIMMVMTAFGFSALLLAAIGIYGLMAYNVEQRKQEMCIRLALGAQTRQVRSMVVRQAMSLAFVGVIVGVGASLGLTRLMTSFSSERPHTAEKRGPRNKGAEGSREGTFPSLCPSTPLLLLPMRI